MTHITMPSRRTRRADILSALRVTLLAALATAPTLLSGCVINLDGGSPGASAGSGSSPGSGSGIGEDSNMDPSPAPVHRLPPPSVGGSSDGWVLDADAQKRFDEVAQYLWERYQALGWQILLTVQTPGGDVIDWLSAESVEGSQEEPPPAPTETQLPDGVQLSLTEVDLFPWLRGPEGSVPVMRPSFAAYVSGLSGASSLEDFLKNQVVPGDPAGDNRLYAGIISNTPNMGASTWVNAFGGQIDMDTMSLLEMAVVCPVPNTGKIWQQIGIAASRDWATQGKNFPNFGDPTLRVRVEFYTVGLDKTGVGDNVGGWDGVRTGFVHAAWAPFPVGIMVTPSIVDGPQFEQNFSIQLWNGNWWVGFNGRWLGYYPGKLFGEGPSNLLASQACEIAWYGEVYYPDTTPTRWTPTDMGSGEFAEAGFGKAAHFRNPFYIDLSGTPQWPANPQDVGPRNDACYTKTALLTGQSPWDRLFYLGGPGGDAPNGDCPAPH
jgi:hypothetical protein